MGRMKWYGSVQNRIHGQATSKTPKVGMGVTELLWSDRHAYEVIEVTDEKHIKVRALKYTRTDNCGISEHQEYKYESDPEGTVKHLVFRNGRWRDRVEEERVVRDAAGNVVKDANGDCKFETVLTQKLGCNEWYIGKAEEYRDPSF